MDLKEQIESIHGSLEKKQQSMDRILQKSRDMVRMSSKAITLMHSGKMDDAASIVSGLDAQRDEMLSMSKEDGMGFYSVQPLQEYVEAKALLGIIKEGRIPLAAELGVQQEPYVLGLMDVVGELKREILESISSGKGELADAYLAKMKEIYDSTRGIRFSDSVLPGFRRKQDVARAQIESAWSDILSSRR
jgi:translin